MRSPRECYTTHTVARLGPLTIGTKLLCNQINCIAAKYYVGQVRV